jgi:hypothetical protein
MPETTIEDLTDLPGWRATIQFRSHYTLTQECGQEFWRRGVRFRTRPGAKTYEWATDVHAADAITATAHLHVAVAEVLEAAGISAPVQVLLTTVEPVENAGAGVAGDLRSAAGGEG